MTSTVTDRIEAPIPPEIAREFELSPGTILKWEKSEGGAIQITPLSRRGERARALLGAGRRWLKPGDDPIGDLIREREDESPLR